MTTAAITQTTRRPTPDFGQLAASIEGTIVLPGDEGYDEARAVHDPTFDRWPAAIVRVAGTADVAKAIRFARDYDIAIAVRSGGHQVIGLSVLDDALVVDLGGLKGIAIDPVTRIAKVQPGVISGELAAEANKHGLALTTGDTSTVGIGGITVGGGIGFMVRKYGLTIDHLLSAEVVTADGRIVRASSNENPELFWALRGGGGNFGVVTEYVFRLDPVDKVYGGMFFLPATREVIRGYLDYTPNAPEDLTTLAHLIQAPPLPFIPAEWVGRPVVGIIACWTGAPEDGPAAFAPMYALGELVAEVVDVMPYPSIYQFDEVPRARHGAELRSMFSQDLSDAAIDAMIEAITNASSPFNLVQLRGLGGALAKVETGATAFAHRDAKVLTLIVSIWMDPNEDDAPHRQWTRDLWAKVQAERDGVYVNFVANEGEPRIREAYAHGTYERLARVKRTWDPDNVFQGNQNIRPE
jgi:FAD/FMN-containing dehydrogenase